MLPQYLIEYPRAVSRIRTSILRQKIQQQIATEHAQKHFSEKDNDTFLATMKEMQIQLVIALSAMQNIKTKTNADQLLNNNDLRILHSIDAIEHYLEYYTEIYSKMLKTKNYTKRFNLLCDFYDCYLNACQDYGSCMLLHLSTTINESN